MTRQEAEILIAKYTEGEANPAEKQLVEYHFHKYVLNSVDTPDPVQLQKDNKLIWNNLAMYMGEVKSTKYKLWPRIAVAAAAVAAIALGVYFFNASRHGNTSRPTELVSGSQEIAPGKNGASITLANGKVIELSDTKSGVIVGAALKYNDGTAVPNEGPRTAQDGEPQTGQMVTASTARGQTYQFTLPDGTKVWLNADSKISFPAQFSGGDRKILLTGEAYFEVAKQIRKPTRPIDKGTMPREKNGMERVPFIVETDQQIVEVLGTHFNVNSYLDEGDTKTTLLEGSVRVLYPAKGPAVPTFYREDIVLQPSQQSVLTGPNRIAVNEVDVTEAVAWKNGEFMFKAEALDQIMKKVARWYDVEVVYLDEEVRNKRFDGTITRFGNASSVLKMLELTGHVHFKIEGKKVTVSK
jgi:ferric-dicitrate binding protein FerR (iron transport regulator)